jgi:hypothetical protein
MERIGKTVEAAGFQTTFSTVVGSRVLNYWPEFGTGAEVKNTVILD